jgi:hypothetical protein
MLDRHLEVHDGKAIMVKYSLYISVIMIMELLDEQLGRQSRCAPQNEW